MDPVTHFEMPAKDRERMADFYTKVFDWKTQLLGPDMGNYVLATTTPIDENRMTKNPGAINGGFFPVAQGNGAIHPMLVIAVKDIRKSIEKIKKGGGGVLGEPVMIPGIGEYVSFNDTEGNRMSILQPLPKKVYS